MRSVLQVSGHPAIAPHMAKFYGIRNGIDQDLWDPTEDRFLPRRATSYPSRVPSFGLPYTAIRPFWKSCELWYYCIRFDKVTECDHLTLCSRL